MKPIILALDDDPHILELLRSTLEFEGYDVVTASTVKEFRACLANCDVAVFLIDLNLPDGSGFELLKELRQGGRVGIIILTGRLSETDHVVGLEIGADDYITKPFRRRELGARVNAVYRRACADRMDEPPSTQPVPHHVTAPVDFEFDEYSLSIASRRLWHKDGEEILLTTAEFDLLSALLRRRGQVLDRDQLMNAIKGRDWESYDRAVDGLISRLRRKIPVKGRATHFIRTVHGIGYSLAV